MEMQDTLKLVIQAVHATTNSHGPSATSAHVAGFLKAPESADPLDLFSIAGMRLGDFYSHSNQNLDRDELWVPFLAWQGNIPQNIPHPRLHRRLWRAIQRWDR